jgi:hypothetical protein
LHRLLATDLGGYLNGRRHARSPESPLVDVAGPDQSYIYYDKGALAFFTLQDYLGEDLVDRVLRQFVDANRFCKPPYPTSLQFLAKLKAAAGPKWQPLIDDLFGKISLFDNRMVAATAKKLPDGQYEVTMHVHADKYYADGKGRETHARADIPIEVGVFAKAANGEEEEEKPLYLAKVPVNDGDSTITVKVDGKPCQAAIDPFNELIDRVSDDNRAPVTIQ